MVIDPTMNLLQQLRFILQISRAQGIARRYFVVNGFDGALTLLGLNMGFYLSGGVEISIAIHAGLGAAVALGMSGLSSAYLSEAAERQRSLAELESAMVSDLSNSAQGVAAKVVPILVALVNGFAPFTIALLIMTPLWLAQAGLVLPLEPVVMAIAIAFAIIAFLGLFLARISGDTLLWGMLKTLLIAVTTVLLITLLET